MSAPSEELTPMTTLRPGPLKLYDGRVLDVAEQANDKKRITP